MAMLARFLSNNAIERQAIRTLRSAWPQKLWLLASAAAVFMALTEAAKADDIFVTKAPAYPFAGLTGPAYNWNGFYAGGHMGIAWGQSNWTAGPGLSGSTNLFAPIDTFDEGGSFFFGLQGGYNYVLPNRILLGAEVDASFPSFQTLSGISIGGISNFTSPTLGAVSHSETVLSSGTVRGRIGYAPGSWLFYATGGFAWTYNQQSLTQLSTGNGLSPFLWRLGWTAGAGVEVPIVPHWTARLEYLFTDYGTNNKTFFGTQPFNSDFQLQELRLGLNYQFGSGAVPASAPIVTKEAAAPAGDILSLHGQSTFVYQGYPTFRSPYEGAQSLPGVGNARETFDISLFAGLRLWQGAEFWIDPEIDQGHGLGDTHGVAGFTSGESYKLGFDYPYARANIRPAARRRSRLALTLSEREEISRGIAAAQSARSMARLLGRSPSTVSRELNRNGGYDRYRAARMRWPGPEPVAPTGGSEQAQIKLVARADSRLAQEMAMSVITCHTRRSIAAYLFKPAACLRKSCLVTFDRSGRSADLCGQTQMAIDGGKSRISCQSVSGPRRLKIVRSLVIGKAISCPGQRTATSRPWSSVIRVM